MVTGKGVKGSGRGNDLKEYLLVGAPKSAFVGGGG